jgi:hypothetical protein
MKTMSYKWGSGTARKPLDPTQRRRSQLVCFARVRAKSAGLAFDLDVHSLVWPEKCPVFGTPLVYSNMRKSKDPRSPSLDRVDSSKGYTKGNVRVISWYANRLKQNGTAAEHEAIAKYMRDNV